VDPAIYTGYDTIVATAGNLSSTDTIKVRLYFGSPPDTPVAVNPLDTGLVAAASLPLVFSVHDPDGDSLTYDVYFGTDPGALSLLATTTVSGAVAGGLASNQTYYWRVVARDWKSQTSSPLWKFTTGTVH
ncbi:MAG TPA: hypothetical protein VKF42_07495, partial [Chitinivibrionales bacterium]|nr:hypothetical protein [Chitinivibrionales bacterium]